MNERFENLAEDAMVLVPGRPGLHTRAFSLEKFAESIVRECVFVVNDAVDHRESASTYADKIKQHFGIKE